MVDISDWTDGDLVNGVSDQTTFDGESCMRLDTNVAAGSNLAKRYRDVGTFGNRVVIEIRVYHATLGSLGNNDYFRLIASSDDARMQIIFATDGMFVFDGSFFTEEGTNIVKESEWQKWVFDWDFSQPATGNVDIYLNDALIASAVDCSYTGTFDDGYVEVEQEGGSLDNRISYIDYIRIGDDCGGFSSSSGSASVSGSVSVSSSSLSSESVSSSSESSSSISVSVSSSSSESVSQSSESVSASVSSSSSESTSVSSSSSESVSSSSSSISGSPSSSLSSESVSVSVSSSSSSEDYAFYATTIPIEITPHSPVVFGSHQASAMSLTISSKTVTFPLYGRMGQPIITGSKPKVICEGAKSYIDFSARNVKILMSGY